MANGRVLLAIATFVAFTIRPIGPVEYQGVASGLLLGYGLYALGLVAAVPFWGVFGREHTGRILHLADGLWLAAITIATGGPVSPAVGLFPFALLAAAYRWGRRDTIVTGTAAVVVLIVEAVLVIPWAGARPLVAGSFELNLVVVRASYLFIGGVLLGYVAEEKNHLRAEASAVARIIAKTSVVSGVRAAVEAVLGELLEIFSARVVLLAAYDGRRDRVHLWEARRGADGDPAVSCTLRDERDRQTYLFDAPAEPWCAVERWRRSSTHPFETRSLHSETNRLRKVDVVLPEAFRGAHLFRSILVARITFGEEWEDRLFLLDAKANRRQLQLLQALTRHIGPVVHNIELMGRLRERAGAAERARVSRELHDGIIQALIGLEMQVDVWRREAASAGLAMAPRLGYIQEVLRAEVQDLRDLIQQMKPVDVDPKRLLDSLADLVEQFQRQTGILAHFVSETRELRLSPKVASEVVRIIQEALVNVRKHSGARHVLVRVSAPNGFVSFEVDDDGRGFGFAGRLSQAELDQGRKGPVVIKERVRSIGGELAIESAPGQGARLEVLLPRPPDG